MYKSNSINNAYDKCTNDLLKKDPDVVGVNLDQKAVLSNSIM